MRWLMPSKSIVTLTASSGFALSLVSLLSLLSLLSLSSLVSGFAAASSFFFVSD